MKLNAIHLQNFRQHADTRIEFDLGLTGVIGPNGAGKSTLLEAIAWALYGNSAARGTRESIRFNRAGSRATVRVELDFDLAGHRYRVVRGLTNAELFLDGADQPIANTITGVTEQLQRRLGMTRAEFFNTYFTGQKELNVMAAMGPSERAQFLSRVLGYEKLRGAQSLVRERRKVITAELAGIRAVMPDADVVARMIAESAMRLAEAARRSEDADRRRQNADHELAALAPRWDAMQRDRERLQELLAESRVLTTEESGLSRDLERVERDLAEIAAARTELERLAEDLAPLTTVAAEFRRYEELAREEGRRLTLVEQERALGDELAQLRERREVYARAPQEEEEVVELLERKRAELEDTLGLLEARRTDWVRDRQEAETKRDALRRQWAEVKAQRDQILDLGEEGVCPTCTRVLGSSFRAVLEQLEGQLDTIKVDGSYYNDRLEQLEEMPGVVKELDEQRRAMQQETGALERRLATVQSTVRDFERVGREITTKEQKAESIQRTLAAIPTGYDRRRHDELRDETMRLAPLNERATRLSTQIEREDALRAERQRTLIEFESRRSRLAELTTQLTTIAFSEVDFQALRTQHEQAAAVARSAEVTAAGARSDLSAARMAVEHAESNRKTLERAQLQAQSLQRDKKLHDELDRAYSDLRTDLNFQLRPELSELASAFLAELTEARYSELELDDQYNIIVLEEGVPKPVISGGEEDLAHLVLRLAISQMIAERAGQAFSLLVLDEVFGSLDETRRHNVVDLLRRLQDRFEQVILITHIESVREGLDRVVSVEYDPETGASRVRQGDGQPLTLERVESFGALFESAGAVDG